MMTSVKGQTCALRLFYYMFGNSSQMGSLSIYVRYANRSIAPAQSFKVNGNLGQKWLRAIVNNSDSRAFQFVIDGQVGFGLNSDIAVDDISFSAGCIASNIKPFNTTTTPVSPTKHTVHNNDKSDKKPSKGIYFQLKLILLFFKQKFSLI